MNSYRVDASLVRYRRCSLRWSLTNGRRPYPTVRPKISLTGVKPNRRLLSSLSAPKCPCSNSKSPGAGCSAPIKCWSPALAGSIPCQPVPKRSCSRKNGSVVHYCSARKSNSGLSLQVPQRLRFTSKNCPQRVALLIQGRRVEYKRKQMVDCKPSASQLRCRREAHAPCSSNYTSSNRMSHEQCNKISPDFDLSIDWAKEALRRYAEKCCKCGGDKRNTFEVSHCCSGHRQSAGRDPLELSRKEKRTRLQTRQTTDKIHELKCVMSAWRKEFDAALDELQKMVKPSVKKYEILDKLQIPEELVAYAYGCNIDDFIL